MNAYGQFRCVRRLLETPTGVVLWSATKDGEDAPPAYAVKVYDPPSYLVADAAGHRADFLESARDQSALASQSQGWATVHDAGVVEGGAAFSVTDLFVAPDGLRPSSAETLSKLPGMVPSRGLASVVTAIVAALRDGQATGRPHGNLKAANVLLGTLRKDDLRGSRVVLIDPAPASRLRPGTDDRPAIAAVICQILFRREFQAESVAIPPEEQWPATGPAWAFWRSLCADLLAANPGARPDFDAITARLAAAPSGKPPLGVPKWAWATAAAILVAGAGVGVGGWKLGWWSEPAAQGPAAIVAEFDEDEYAEIAKGVWSERLERVRAALGPSAPSVFEDVKAGGSPAQEGVWKDDGLRNALKILRSNKLSKESFALLRTSASLTALEAVPGGKPSLWFAWQALEQMEAWPRTASIKGWVGGWSGTDETKRQVDAWENRLAGRPADGNVWDLAGAIARNTGINEVFSLHDEAKATLVLIGAGEPMESLGLPSPDTAFKEATTGTTGLDDLKGRLTAFNAGATRVRELLAVDAPRRLVAGPLKEAVDAGGIDPGPTPALAQWERWASIAGSGEYFEPTDPDPRTLPELAEVRRMSDSHDALAKLLTSGADAALEPGEGRVIADGRRDVEAAAAAFVATLSTTPWIERNRVAVLAQLRTVRDDAAGLGGRIDEKVRVLSEGWAAMVDAMVADLPPSGSAELAGFWEARRGPLRDRRGTERPAASDWEVYRAVRAWRGQFEIVASRLAAIAPPEADPALPPGGSEAIAAFTADARERRVRALIQGTADANIATSSGWTEFDAALTQLGDRTSGLRSIAREAGAVVSGLRDGFVPGEGDVPVDLAMSASDMRSRLDRFASGSDSAATERLRSALLGDLDVLLEALGRVGAGDPAVAAAEGSPAAVRRTALRRLAERAASESDWRLPWPLEVATREIDWLTALAGRADGPRRAAITAEVGRLGQYALSAHIASAPPSGMERAIGEAEKALADRALALDRYVGEGPAAVRYNLALYRIAAASSGALENDNGFVVPARQLVLAASDLEARARPAPSGGRSLSAQLLEEVDNTGKEVSYPDREGPGSMGWTFAKLPPGPGGQEQRAYSKGDLTMIFGDVGRIGEDPGRTFIARDETSIALVNLGLQAVQARGLDVTRGVGKWLAATEGSQPAQTRLSGVGPWIWEVDRRTAGALRLRPFEGGDWFDWKAPSPVVKHPPGLTLPARTERSPAQRITPGAAQEVAAALGCGLPTVAQWQAALSLERLRREERAARGLSPSTASDNIRSEAYRLQFEHVALVTAGGDFATYPRSQTCYDVGNIESRDSAVWPAGGGVIPYLGPPGPGSPVLWFDAADAERGVIFRNLVGNVAEMALATPAADANSSGNVRILGASAISAPTAKAAPDMPLVAPKRQTDSGGFSDLGFRLSFLSSGQLPLGQRLRDAILAAEVQNRGFIYPDPR